MNTPVLLAFFNVGPSEIIVVLVIGLLLFGRRLPEMGRFLGKGLVEFKKGIHGIEDDLEHGGGPVAPRTGAEQQRAGPPSSPQSSTKS